MKIVKKKMTNENHILVDLYSTKLNNHQVKIFYIVYFSHNYDIVFI